MWLFGKRLLRPLFAFLGIVAGGICGMLLFPMLAPAEVFGTPSPYVGLMAGLALGLVAAVVLFRVSVGLTTATAAALMGVLVAGTVLHIRLPDPTHAHPSPALLAAWDELAGDRDPNRASAQSGPPRTTTVHQRTAALADRVLYFLRTSADHIADMWTALPRDQRVVLALSAGASALIGLVFGLLAPERSAAGATALFGSAIMLGAFLWLAHALNIPGREVAARGGAIGILIVWLAIAGLGFAFQVGFGTPVPATKKSA